MREIYKNPDTLVDISRLSTALYPEFSRRSSALLQEFVTRGIIAGKQICLFKYGSPNHGDQFWRFEGSPIRTMDDVIDGKRDSEFTLLEFVLGKLREDTAALFSTNDFKKAMDLGVLRKLAPEEQIQIQTFLSNQESNGILLVSMAQS